MTVVVTGGTGHLGTNLVRRLVRDGRTVRVVVHDDDSSLEGLDIERIPGDVTDKASLAKAFEGADTVLHLAARISILNRDPVVEGINIGGARNAAEASLETGVRRHVHVSSIHAFLQEPQGQVLDETRGRPAPHYPPYDRSKAAGEAEVQKVIARGLDAVIVNPTAILGPYDHRPSRMGEVLLRFANGTMSGLISKVGFNWVDARDVVDGILGAEERGRTGENYLLGGEWRSFENLAEVACSATGARIPRLMSPMWLARVGAPFVTAWSRLTGARPLYTSAALHALRGAREISSEKAKKELGYAPRPFEDTIGDAYAWFSENGMLKRPLP